MHSQTIEKMEDQVALVIKAMEERGLSVGVDALQELIHGSLSQKMELQSKLKDIFKVGDDINFNSSRDVSILLKEKMGVESKRTTSGRFSASRKFLKHINNPITDDISNYKDLDKLHSTLSSIYRATDKAKGKIFCKYTNDCATGRLYTKDYNFQGIPEIGRKIIYADKDCSFILADYDSFELRIMSALSHDTYFKACWAKGLDLHRKVVSDMQGIPYENVTINQRKIGKILNFGLAYCQKPAGLARNLNTSIANAERLMKKYKEKIPEIESFKLKTIEAARILGYTDTYFGRRRFLADINSPSISLRKKAERQAINTQCQGWGSDIVKFSLAKLHSEGFLIDAMLHDSILLTVPDNKIDSSLKRIKEIMEIEIEGTKLPVTCGRGKTWAECY